MREVQQISETSAFMLREISKMLKESSDPERCIRLAYRFVGGLTRDKKEAAQ